MRRLSRPWLLAGALSIAAACPALADDCDCSRRVGLCQAGAVFDGTKISFTSQTDQCSRISFMMDDQPAAITIRKGAGEARVSAPGLKAGAEVPIDGCYVCDLAETRR